MALSTLFPHLNSLFPTCFQISLPPPPPPPLTIELLSPFFSLFQPCSAGTGRCDPSPFSTSTATRAGRKRRALTTRFGLTFCCFPNRFSVFCSRRHGADSCRIGRRFNRISIHVSFPAFTTHFLFHSCRPRSHVGSVVSCVDIIRQGRGSLVTTIEIYKIIALNCLVNAFVLSVREMYVFA